MFLIKCSGNCSTNSYKIKTVKWKSLSHVPLSAIPWIIQSMELYRNTRMGSLSLLWGIFQIQGSNPGLLHSGRILYQPSHKGSPRILEWVANTSSSESSRPRNWTRISCIGGGFFTNWAIREANPPSYDWLKMHFFFFFFIYFY